MRIALIAVLLLSCASPAPTEYRDGPLVRPPPVRPVPGYTPPGTGLPEYFVPPQRRLPPEPRPTRVLPETPESRRGPGIWASGGPRAAVDGDKAPSMFQVLLPVPIEDPHPKDRSVAGYCGASMELAAQWAGRFREADALKKTPRTCLAAMLYAFCMNNRQDHQWVVDEAARRHPPVRKEANAFEAKSCTKELRDALKPLVDAIADTWTTYALESGR